MNERNNAIAYLICAAQASSDGCKSDDWMDEWEEVGFLDEYKKDYSFKDYCIRTAISLINRSKRSDFRYSIIQSPDQNGYDSYVIYFEYKRDGKYKQISFHSPARNKHYSKYLVHPNKMRRTAWSGKVGDSRKFALELAKEVVIMRE